MISQTAKSDNRFHRLESPLPFSVAFPWHSRSFLLHATAFCCRVAFAQATEPAWFPRKFAKCKIAGQGLIIPPENMDSPGLEWTCEEKTHFLGCCQRTGRDPRRPKGHRRVTTSGYNFFRVCDSYAARTFSSWTPSRNGAGKTCASRSWRPPVWPHTQRGFSTQGAFERQELDIRLGGSGGSPDTAVTQGTSRIRWWRAGPCAKEEERSRRSVYRVVNAASVVVSLPFSSHGCARPIVFMAPAARGSSGRGRWWRRRGRGNW
jgi:hypothetical protein